MDSRNRAARRGISLLEVLAAMLVLTIGILGMARLIPVGVYELSVAYKLDGASTLGRASFRDLEVRGYLNPMRWYDPAMPNYLLDQTVGPTYGNPLISYNWIPTSRPSPWAVAGNTLPFPPAVVIDPLMLTSPGVTANMVQTFPYSTNPGNPSTSDTLNYLAPWIPRVNLTVTNGSGNPVAMSYALADRIFRSSDEGQYTDPATGPAAGNMRPTMKFNTDASSNRTQSSTLGSDSWFMTVLPTMAETSSTLNPSYARQFAASVVVCNKRDLTLPPAGASVDTPPPGERMLSATMVGTGIGGGDVQVFAPNASSPPQPLKDWISVRPGQWILLSAYVLVPAYPGDANNPPRPAVQRLIADWYRVVGVGDVVSGSNPPSRYVTLHGADWPVALTGASLFATIVDGVTGVYQKTITLDGSSSWQQ